MTMQSVSGMVRDLMLSRYATAKLYHTRKFRRRLANSRDEILVHQMGKVGSSSIIASINALDQGWLTHHIHNLLPEKLVELEELIRQTFARDLVTPKQRASLFRQLISAEYLLARLARPDDGWSLKVVTLVRDPVARNLSGLFEVLDLELDYGLEEKLRTRGREETLREVSELFFEKYPGHDVPLTFFDTELRRSLGVDVYETPFPKEQGYQIYRRGNIEVLLLRMEDLQDRAVEAFNRFLGITNFRLVNSNVGARKGYADAYRGLLESIRLPAAYLDKMYDSKYATHFYTPGEIEAFRGKWGDGSGRLRRPPPPPASVG